MRRGKLVFTFRHWVHRQVTTHARQQIYASWESASRWEDPIRKARNLIGRTTARVKNRIGVIYRQADTTAFVMGSINA